MDCKYIFLEFLGRGYAIEREQQVPCRGQVLTNYVLEKIL